MVWDFVYARRLLSNGTYRPIHDAVLGFEHCMVAKACLLTQRLPKRFAERLRALEALRHPDGTPVYRVEETKPLLGSRAPRMEAERPKHGVDDPTSHCLAANSLLLTGLPGTGKTHLVVEEITQLDMALWADLACVGLNADVKFLRPGGPSARRWSTASSSATWPAGTGTSSRRTCAPTPASSTS